MTSNPSTDVTECVGSVVRAPNVWRKGSPPARVPSPMPATHMDSSLDGDEEEACEQLREALSPPRDSKTPQQQRRRALPLGPPPPHHLVIVN